MAKEEQSKGIEAVGLAACETGLAAALPHAEKGDMRKAVSVLLGSIATGATGSPLAGAGITSLSEFVANLRAPATRVLEEAMREMEAESRRANNIADLATRLSGTLTTVIQDHLSQREDDVRRLQEILLDARGEMRSELASIREQVAPPPSTGWTVEVTLKGRLEDLDVAKLADFESALRTLSGDASVTIQKVVKSSIKLTLKATQKGAERLLKQFEEGMATVLSGHEIQKVTMPVTPASSSRLGIVKWFNDAKGFGFIKDDNEADVFVHYKQITGDGFRTLEEGQLVRFDLRDGPTGFFAENVRKISD